ncbi:MAG: hypothetical protein NTZ56_13395 [Acidobacteria bacterium]|nr:hypothetical protein [Acidobacteriota bacterium]
MTRPADTDEKTWQFYLSLIRQLTPEQRLRRTIEMIDMGRALAAAGKAERDCRNGAETTAGSIR